MIITSSTTRRHLHYLGKTLRLLGSAQLALFLIVSAVEVQAATDTDQDRARQVETLTRELASLLRQPMAQAGFADTVLDRARVRRGLIETLIQESPATAARYALPAVFHGDIPQEIAGLLEQAVSLSGELDVVYRDEDNGAGQLHYFLNTGEKRYQVFMAEPKPGLRTGMRVIADGVSLDNRLAVSSQSDVQVLAYGEDSDTSTAGASMALEGTLGAQQVAVLLVNFSSQPEVPWSTEQVHDVVFRQASDFLLENSYGKTWLEGDVLGWFTLNVDPVGCPSSDIALAARQAAQEAGHDLSTYERIVFAFPDIGCSYSGEATVGGSPSYAWLDGTVTNAGVVTHELGHNLGLYHAHSLDCDADVLNPNCTVFEYGDVLDRMGDASAGHYNAFQKTRLGWLGQAQEAALLSPGTSGSYTIESLSSQTHGAKALRIPRSVDAATGDTQWFYIEYRDGAGADSFLSESRYGGSVEAGVVVHAGQDSNPNSSGLLDMTPNSQKYDMDDLALAFGSTFTDPVSGTSISVNRASASQAEITVAFDGAATGCETQPPSLDVVSASTGPWVAPGTPLDFSFSLTNRDAQTCADAWFSLTVSEASGWSTELDTPSVLLAAGDTAVVTLTLVSPETALAGFYDFEVAAAHGSGDVSTRVVTYVVDNSDVEQDLQAPTPPVGLTIKAGKKKADLSWQASTDNVAVVGYRVWRNGTLIGTPSGTTFSDFDYQKGASVEYQVEAYDAAGNISAPSDVLSTTDSSEAPSGSTKGGGKGRK